THWLPRFVSDRGRVCSWVDTVCRSRPRNDPTVCQYDRLVDKRCHPADGLFARFGFATLHHGVGCGPVPGLFQTGTGLPVGRLYGEWSVAGCGGRNDLCKHIDDDHQFLRAVWHRLVPGAVVRCWKWLPTAFSVIRCPPRTHKTIRLLALATCL